MGHFITTSHTSVRDHLAELSSNYQRNTLMSLALEAQRKLLIHEVLNSIEPKDEYSFLKDMLGYAESVIETHIGYGHTLLGLIGDELDDNYDINALYEFLPECTH